MFSKVKNEAVGQTTAIHRKTYEQLEMEKLSETVEELKILIEGQRGHIVEAVREELRSFHSKFETWQDIKRIQEDLERREKEVTARERKLMVTDVKES